MPTTTSRRTVPVTHRFADDGRIPNNPALPLVLYRGGIDLAGSPDPEMVIEKRSRRTAGATCGATAFTLTCTIIR